jgi:hypothetical protein
LHRPSNTLGDENIIVTLRRAVSDDLYVADWHEAIGDGDLASNQRAVTLSLVDAQDRPVLAFALDRAWPSALAITTPVGEPRARTPLREEVTLICDAIRHVRP